MRVTGGELRGRLIRVPRGDRVRPTQDRVRAALFSILGAEAAAGGFLDLYAGSGAVGLEAWSRGARPVWWVERDRTTLEVLRQNVGTLCGGGGQVVAGDVARFVRKNLTDNKFSIIFADPPYRLSGGRRPVAEARRERRVTAAVDDALAPGALLAAVAAGNWLAADGLLILEQGVDEALEDSDGWRLVDERVYGVARLRMFRRRQS